MRKLLVTATSLAVFVTPALAGEVSPHHLTGSNATATATGVGIAKSTSVSASQATAISGQGGAGGAGGQGGQGGTGIGVATGGNAGGGSATINSNVPANTTATVQQNIRNSGSISNVPAVFAPGLSSAGLETCLGSVSVGASWLGTGLTGGGSIPDAGCDARLSARTLWSFGLRRAAVARLCLDASIYRSMPEVCALYLPVQTSYGVTPVVVRPQEPLRTLASTGDYKSDGSIMLVDGKTGRDRMCNNYAASRQKCLAWADAPPKANRLAATKQHKPKPAAVVAAPPASAPAVTAAAPTEPEIKKE